MAKSDELAFNKLIELVNKGQTVQIKKFVNKYEVTVWSKEDNWVHHHYLGDTAIEAILKIKE